MTTTVRRLAPGDAEACAALRRAMLVDSPQAFLASPESDRGSDVTVVAERLAGGAEGAMFGAFHTEAGASELVGSVGLFAEPHAKSAHKLHVWGLYVAPRARGRGLGRHLMEALLAHVATLGGFRQVHLSVSETARPARALYESLGFRLWGSEPRALHVDGRDLTEHHLWLPLDAQS